MSTLKIITVPNPKLREKAKKVSQINQGIQKIINDMIDTLKQEGGIGLAATQVGIPLKIAIIKNQEIKKDKNLKIPLTIIINPEIIKQSKETEKTEEGCLSIPGIWGEVERAKFITVKALDDKGKKIKIKASDLLARVLQHEIDHLNGILFTDKVDLKSLHKITPEGEKIKIKPFSL